MLTNVQWVVVSLFAVLAFAMYVDLRRDAEQFPLWAVMIIAVPAFTLLTAAMGLFFFAAGK